MGERIKKICFICPWMHVAGGLQRVVTDLANRLSANYDVIICIISILVTISYTILIISNIQRFIINNTRSVTLVPTLINIIII